MVGQRSRGCPRLSVMALECEIARLVNGSLALYGVKRALFQSSTEAVVDNATCQVSFLLLGLKYYETEQISADHRVSRFGTYSDTRNGFDNTEVHVRFSIFDISSATFEIRRWFLV